MSNNIAVSWVDSSAPVESYEEAIKPNTKVMLKFRIPYIITATLLSNSSLIQSDIFKLLMYVFYVCVM